MESLPEPPPQRKRRGPIPRLGVQIGVHVKLPPDLVEWAKNQPEGMSALIRRLLAEEQQRRSSH